MFKLAVRVDNMVRRTTNLNKKESIEEEQKSLINKI
jgi:hypothetical protein